MYDAIESVKRGLAGSAHIVLSLLLHVLVGVLLAADRRGSGMLGATQRDFTGISMYAQDVDQYTHDDDVSDFLAVQSSDSKIDRTGMMFLSRDTNSTGVKEAAGNALATNNKNSLKHHVSASNGRKNGLALPLSLYDGNVKSVMRAVVAKNVAPGENLVERRAEDTNTNTKKRYSATRVKEALKDQLAKCWSIPLHTNLSGAAVKIKLVLDSSGRVRNHTIADAHSYNVNPMYRALADSAMRAIYKCSPLSCLQELDHSLWHETVITFHA